MGERLRVWVAGAVLAIAMMLIISSAVTVWIFQNHWPTVMLVSGVALLWCAGKVLPPLSTHPLGKGGS